MSRADRLHDGVPVLFGEILFDCFEDGSRVLGGAPFNVAWHLQAFGFSPLLISRVGDDAMGREIAGAMQAWGMTTAGLQRDPDHATGEVRVRLRAGQPSFEIMPDRAWDHIAPPAVPGARAALVYHGSLGLRHEDASAALDALLAAQSAPVFVDVNLRPPWWDEQRLAARLARAEWVKVNDTELDLLVRGSGTLAEKSAALVERHGLEGVIVTRGADGALACAGDGTIREVAPVTASAVVDTVGAGDGFAAVCLTGLMRDWPVDQMLDCAQRFASLIVAQRGAILEDRAVYRQLVKDWNL